MTLHLRPFALCLLLATSLSAPAQSDNGKAARFYENALKRYNSQDYAGAAIQLKNSLQVDKNQLAVHLLLGKVLLADSKVAAAEVEFNEALRLGVNRAEVVVPLAKSMAAQGKQAQMFDDSRLQITGLPAGVQLKLLLARASAYSDVGDARNAMKSVADARAISPNDPDSWMAEVPLRIRAAQFKEAMTAADTAIKLAPEASAAAYQRAAVLHVTGQIADALAGYERSLKLDGANVEAMLARTGILIDTNRDKEASASLKELLQLAPSDPRGTYLRAVLAERAGDKAVVKSSMKSITALLDPVPIEYMRYRSQILMLNGLAHFELKEFEKAKPYLEYASKQQPNSPLTKLLAQIALQEPNVPRAVELLETYLKTRPGDGQALLMLASAQMTLGRHAKATALLQEGLQANDSPVFRTALGLSLMRGGQSAGATAELEKAFKADPKQITAGLALVNLYLKTGPQAKAQQIADDLAKANPGNPTILLMQATARFQSRSFDAARTGFEAVLKLNDKLLPAELGLAQVEQATQAYDAANKRLRRLLRANERDVDILFQLATLYEAWGKNEDALAFLQSAADASSQRQTRANYALVAWQLRKGTPTAALDAAKVLLSKQPDEVEAMLVYAQAQMANADLPGARVTLTNAARRSGFEAPLLERIARAQLDAKDINAAAYSLDKALQGSPDFLPALALMSTVELLQKLPAKAEQHARQIIQTYPKAALGYGLLADVETSRGRTAAAIESLRRAYELEKTPQNMLRVFWPLSAQDGGKPAIDLAQAWLKLHPKDIGVMKAVAQVQVRANNFAAAKRLYESVLALQPSDVDALNNLANVLIQQKDPGAAVTAEKALAQDPGNPIIIDTAGWAQSLAGNKDRALQLLREARLRAPDNPDIRFHLAAVLAQAGRRGEAREEVSAALQGGRDFRTAADARALLSTLN